MATPVTDLHARLRGAGLTEPQAEAIAAGFEALERRLTDMEQRLDRRMAELERRMDLIEVRLRWHGRGLVLIIGLIVAPYVGALFGLAAP
jgi:tetrahydromethanopterin S-methyltransferase subunit G